MSFSRNANKNHVCMYGIQELTSIEIAKSILSLTSNSLTHDLRMHLTL